MLYWPVQGAVNYDGDNRGMKAVFKRLRHKVIAFMKGLESVALTPRPDSRFKTSIPELFEEQTYLLRYTVVIREVAVVQFSINGSVLMIALPQRRGSDKPCSEGGLQSIPAAHDRQEANRRP